MEIPAWRGREHSLTTFHVETACKNQQSLEKSVTLSYWELQISFLI